MWSKFTIANLLLVMAGVATLLYFTPSAFASHIDWDARRAEREAEREARRIERDAERAARNEPNCTCSATLSYAKPSLQFSGGTLMLIPRADVMINLRGDADGAKHSVGLTYSGSTSYASDDVGVPSGISFSGDKTVLPEASCEGRWSLKGIELGRISLSGLTQSLVGNDQELTGTVKLNTAIAGCGFEEENRQFSFRLQELGNVKSGGWRSVR